MIEASMSAVRAAIATLAACAACHRAPSTPRERVLAGLPAGAVAVVAADGRALAHPRIRGVLDVLAARWPASLGCVVDAAVASDAIAASFDRAGNLTVLAAMPRAPRCPALSQRAPGLWIATLGAGPAASAALRDDPRFARARPYLESSPIAAAVLGDVHLVAAAQPDPLDAWIALDVPGGADPVAQAIAALTARLAREPTTSALAARLTTTRPGPSQVVLRLTGPLDEPGSAGRGSAPESERGVVDGDLAAAVRTGLTWADTAGPRAAAAPAFACPDPAGAATCVDGKGTSYRVASLATDLGTIVTVGRPSPLVVNGSIAGLRLDAAVRDLGLQAGDVIVAVAGRLVTSRTMLADWIAHARVATTVTVRRGGSETVLSFAER